MSESDGSDIESLLLSYAKQSKANARGEYHDVESGTFEQGIKLGRLHAMSDVIEFIHENCETDGDRDE